MWRRKKAAALILLRRRTRLWVHPINLKRKQQGDFYSLIRELSLDSSRFRNYFRMSAAQMEIVLSFIGLDLQKQTKNFREAIEPKQTVAVTLR